MKTRRGFALTLALCLVGVGIAHACSIPVFRYALERWELANYEVVVFHKGHLNDDLRKQLDRLDPSRTGANLKVETFDVDAKLPSKRAAFWKRQGNPQTPWVVVRNPDAEDKTPPVYAGAASIEAILPLLDSPARHTIVQRLARGESAVFVLLESGDGPLDAKASDLLETELPRLAKATPIPEQTKDGPQLKFDIPLRVAFSTLKVRRDDPKEAGTVRLLLATEEGLDDVKGPIVFPVFGRGRALCSLYGKDLSKTQLANVSKFLCGACSCQVKDLNPGIDLLLTADWPELLRSAGPARAIPKDDPAPNKKP